jgi:putative addiction module component (TIGR02574 family)
MNVRVEDLKKLPLADRVQLVEDLWDSIAGELDAAPLSPELIAEMEKRRAAYARDPSTGVEWEDLQKRLGKPK